MLGVTPRIRRLVVSDQVRKVRQPSDENIECVKIESPVCADRSRVNQSNDGLESPEASNPNHQISFAEFGDGRTNLVLTQVKEDAGILGPLRKVESSTAAQDKSTPTIRKLHRLKTKMHLDYFGDEEAEKLSRMKIQNEYFYSESEVNFSISQYIEFFFYHLLYFMFLGPFVVVLILCKPSLKNLFYNMEFLRANYMSVTQAVYWFITMFIIAGFVLAKTAKKPEGDSVFDMTLFKTIITSIILRTTSIAGKYATYPKQLIRKYKETKIDKRLITQEFMLIGWLAHRADVRHNEIANSVDRLEIDESTFVMSYMTVVSEQSQSKLKELSEAKSGSQDKELSYSYQLNDKLFKYYKAEIVFEYLITQYNARVNYKSRILFGVMLGMVWSFIPSFLRLLSGQNFHGQTGLGKAATYLNGLLSSFLFYVQYMFYIQAIIDLQRKYFIMCQLGYIISPRILKQYPYPKLLPTMSILDPVSMHTWYNFRRMALDYGRKYFYRHEIFLPVNLLLMFLNILVYFVYLYLSRAGIVDNQQEVTRILYSCVIDSSLFMWAGFHFMYSAGRLNDEFDFHLGLISHNKGLIANLLEFRHYYFSELIGSSNRVGRDLKKILPKESRSALHTIVRDEVVKMVQVRVLETEDMEARNELLAGFLQEIINDYDKLSDDLNRDKLFEQSKILGFSVQKNSVVNFAFAIVSAIFTVYQLLFGGG